MQPTNDSTDSVNFKLAIKPTCHLVNFSHVHLDRHMAIGAHDEAAGGASPQHVQVHKLPGIFLHVEGAPAATVTSGSTEKEN